MSSLIVVAVYLGALAIAILLLFELRNLAWYWHAASVAVALAIGVMPPLEHFVGPAYDLAVGAIFIVLMVWGLGAPLFHHSPDHAHAHSHHH